MGYIRENHPKFSLKWLLWIHASIPLIIYLRLTLGILAWFIPITIALAVLGQVLGSRWRRKIISPRELARFKRIPPMATPNKIKISDATTTVVLLNMGGPRTNKDVADFQRRLFSDPLLIRFPLSFLFQRFFAWVLVTLRTKAAKGRYQLIGGGSPIFDSTQRQVTALTEELRHRGRAVDVIFSFNYSAPFPEDTMRIIQQSGKTNVLLLSLYPHYSQATTGSSIYHLKKAADQIYPQAKFWEAPAYHLHDGYIRALVDRIQEQIKAGESLDDFYLIFSAHGLPMYFLIEGDPYPFQINQTVAGILCALGRRDRWVISYQSAVGPFQWFRPYTEDVIEALIRHGFKKLLVIPVSFVTDHIETSCEIDIEYRHLAQGWGVEDFRMSRAIECHPGFIRALADSVEAVLNEDAMEWKALAHDSLV